MAIGHAQLYQEFYNYDMQQKSDVLHTWSCMGSDLLDGESY